MRFRTNREGFTLIELLVVIAIIAILAAILFPVFARAREKARQSTCSSNQRQIAASIQMYAQDHDEAFPPLASVWSSINVDAGVLVCPTLGKSTPNGYAYNGTVSNTAIGSITDPTTAVLSCDSTAAGNVIFLPTDVDTRHTNKAIMSFADGHVNAGLSSDFVPIATNSLLAGLGTGALPATVASWSRNPADISLICNGSVSRQTIGDPTPDLQFLVRRGGNPAPNGLVAETRDLRPFSASCQNAWVLTGDIIFPSTGWENSTIQVYDGIDTNSWGTGNALSTLYRRGRLEGGNWQCYMQLNGTSVVTDPNVSPSVGPYIAFTRANYTHFLLVGINGKVLTQYNYLASAYTNLKTTTGFVTPQALTLTAAEEGGGDTNQGWLIKNLYFGAY